MIEIIKDYQKQAQRTCVLLPNADSNYYHMILGLFTEWGELCDIYKRALVYSTPLDVINIEEEWADFGWYLAGYTHFNVANIDRYYDLFTKESEDEISLFYDDINFNEFPKDTHLYLLLSSFSSCFSQLQLIGTESALMKFTCWWWSTGTKLGINKERALEKNINKLKVRYPEKFSIENALNRDLNKERRILES